MRHIRTFDKHESGEMNENNRHKLMMMFKQKAKERAAEKKKELDKVVIPEEEQIEILKAVKAKKYDVSSNMEKLKKLQSMGLIRAARGVEISSSFSFPFYLTKKGESILK